MVSSASGQSTAEQLRALGLIDWNLQTWSLRPALNIQYILPVSRTLVTFASEAVGFFYTRIFPLEYTPESWGRLWIRDEQD